MGGRRRRAPFAHRAALPQPEVREQHEPAELRRLARAERHARIEQRRVEQPERRLERWPRAIHERRVSAPASLSVDVRVRTSCTWKAIEVALYYHRDALTPTSSNPTDFGAAPAGAWVDNAGDNLAGTFTLPDGATDEYDFVVTIVGQPASAVAAAASPWLVTPRRSNEAVATLLTTDNADYLRGALVLGSSIRSFDSSRVMVCLVTKAVPAEWRGALSVAGWTVREVDEVREFWWDKSSECSKFDADQAERWGHMATKLRLWQLTQYERIMYLLSLIHI